MDRPGAPWPDDATQKKYRDAERTTPLTADRKLVKASGGLSDEWTYRRYKLEDVWAFRSVKKPDVYGQVVAKMLEYATAEKGKIITKREAAAERRPRSHR